MSRRFFEEDNGLMSLLSQIGDYFYLSLFWILGCFPVVTLGASTAALYDACYHAFRKGEKTSWHQFLMCYKENWKTGILPSVLYLAVFAGVSRVMIGLWNRVAVGAGSWAVFAGVGVVAALVLGILSVMFPMMSRFDNSVGVLLKNTLLLALANLPRTLCLGLLTAASIVFCARLLAPLFFLPALTAAASTFFLEPMFKPYMPEEPEESEMPLE